MINIYKYYNYRDFAQDFLKVNKGNRDFSQRNILKKMGVTSSGFLANVLSGKQHFTIKQSTQFAAAINLSEEQSHYFKLMVHFARSKKLEEKNGLYETLNVFRKKKLRKLSEKQLNLFSKWYNPVILEILHFYDFENDFTELGKMVDPSIKSMDVKYAIRELEGLGLIKKDKNGFYRPKDSVMTTGDEVQSFLVKNFQIDMLENEIKSLTSKTRAEREISGLTLAISKNDFNKVKSEIRKFRKKILQIAEVSKSPEQVYRCHFSVFAVSKDKKDIK